MHVDRLFRFTLTLAAVAALPGIAAAASPPTGLWIDHTGRGGVEIKECGKALCGKLVWLKDEKNKKACGTEILGNVRAMGDGSWDGGWIYSPEKKKKYDVELRPVGDDKLKVVGYAGTKLFSQTMTWTRAPDGLAPCAGETIAAGATPAAAAPAKSAALEAAPPSDKEPREMQSSDASGALALGKIAASSTASQPSGGAPAPADASKPPASAAAASPDGKKPDAKSGTAVRTAAADKPTKPEKVAKRRNDDDDDAKPKKKYCKLEVPFVTVRIPCPD